MKEFINKLTGAMIPKYYRYVDEVYDGDIDLVYRGRDYLISRQMVAIVNYNKRHTAGNNIEGIRRKIKDKYKGIYVLREIGLQVIVLVDDFDSPDLETLKADKYATNSIIIQGLHIASFNDQAVLSLNSQWGKVTFGKGKKINTLLSELVRF